MAKNFMQCCYTRVGGQSVSSGWQTVAASDGITPDIYKTYLLLQNANVPSQTPTDEAGIPLNVFELVGTGENLFMTHIQYGLTDNLNRQNNMFAHSFIFSLKDIKTIQDPNSFLTITEKNYKISEEEAVKIPEELLRDPAFSIEGALQACGLDHERYIKLIRCIFAQYNGKSKKPLHILYQGDEYVLRAFLYCIYRGIPYFMRRCLTVATADVNDQQSKDLIFSKTYSAMDYYFDPATGENNILTGRLENKFSRVGYVDYYPVHYKEKESEDYFARLEENAVKYGDITASDELVLKIVHQLMQGFDLKALDENQLNDRVYDALKAKSKGSLLMDDYIASLIKRMSECGFLLTDDKEEMLVKRLGGTTSKLLLEAGEAYNINQLSHMTEKEAAERLHILADSVFKVYSRKLAQTPAGQAMMDYYYTTYCLNEDVTWIDLDEMLREVEYLKNKPSILDKVESNAWELYSGELKSDKLAVGVLGEYLNIMHQLLPKEQWDSCLQAAKEEYWNHFTFTDFDIEKSSEYHFFESMDSKQCLLATDLQKLFVFVKQNEWVDCLSQIAEFSKKYQEEMSITDKEWLMKQLSDQYMQDEEEIEIWFYASTFLMEDSILEEVIQRNTNLKEGDFEKFVDEYPEIVKNIKTGTEKEEEIWDKIKEILIQTCEEADQEEMVPLDVWLVLGESQFDNPFSIFNRFHPAILEEEAVTVCEESERLGEDEFLDAAKKYISDNKGEARTVKEWISTWKKLEKKQKAEEKRNAKSSSEKGRRISGFWSRKS